MNIVYSCRLTEKEIEVSELRQEREDLLNSKSAIEAKYKESTATIESLNKELLKLEIELKNVKAENDSLKKVNS